MSLIPILAVLALIPFALFGVFVAFSIVTYILSTIFLNLPDLLTPLIWIAVAGTVLIGLKAAGA